MSQGGGEQRLCLTAGLRKRGTDLFFALTNPPDIQEQAHQAL